MQREGELQFVNPPPGFDFDCPVCLTSFKEINEVCQATCCGNHFCHQCTDRLKNSMAKCPNCRSDNFDATLDRFFLRLYLSLEVRCYYSNTGCKWTGELRQLDEHVKKNCTSGGSAVSKNSPTSDDSIRSNSSHYDPNPEQVQLDLKKCSLQEMPAPKGSIPSTANGALSTVPLSFTMTGYLRHLESGEPWYSPPFYTHQRGYKLSIQVDPNINRNSNHLCVHVCILKGEYDHQLQWPLYAEVGISLLNYRENGNNIIKSFYLPGDEYCKRVEVNRVAAQGIRKFASNKELPYNLSKNTQYLIDDCLNFRVETVTILQTPSTPELPSWADRDCVINFALHLFEKSKINGSTSFYGPSFYTHKGGYKLAIKIYPNGSGTGTGSHVSIEAVLLSTNEDNTLIWPFDGELGIELVNWREDRNHKSCTFRFDKNASPQEVVHDETHDNFISHSQLAYTSSTNSEYLYNDCLLFKVTFAVAYSTPCCNNAPFWKQGLTYTSALEFTLNKFTIRTLYGNCYYSKPFLASGYKMQISVKANVNGYIGVYVHLMKGPNDDKLVWPFCGDVVVELVNWIEDKYHHRRVIKFNARNRVLVSDRSEGWSDSQFIHCSTIYDYFFNDDCLYFRVSDVTVHSNDFISKRPQWQSPNSPLSPFGEFTVANLSKQMENKPICGSDFFTHNEGYKLRLEIQKSADQQHISLYARLLRGQNDHNLIWPFQASIVVQLINWREDANHHSYTISFNELTSLEAKSQVTTGTEAPAAWGTNRFISYTSLGYDGSKNKKYLQDDCLRFRVKELIVYSNPLMLRKPPWQSWRASIFFEHNITRFLERLRLQEVYWSPPFYTSARGYRMCLKVYPSGTGLGEGTHVSVHGCLMKGDYDDELNWPFTADVVVDILNWRGDYHHHRLVLQFNENSLDDSRSRVHRTNELGHSWGISKAIEIEALFPLHSSNVQYLADDCMCIRMDCVAVYSTPLLYKTPCWDRSLTSHPLMFTVTGVTNHMQYNTPCYSPPFYSHKKGYKLRLDIHPNGISDGAGTHVSIHLRLLKGEYDNGLVWPIKSAFAIEILNWCRNSLHYKQIIYFSKAAHNVCMPVTGDSKISVHAWGLYRFCPHATLFTNTGITQYVQENCICVRVYLYN